MRISALRAPFPWFGGKRRVAHLVWPRFGNVPNYVEPFAGSLAVLLARPEAWPPRNETVNDLDCYLANFWRAVARDPGAVAAAADWPVNEADLHARHRWLHAQAGFRERMHSDPDHFDAKIAGWWAWGVSCWIGDNWCRVGPQESAPVAKPQGVNALGPGPSSGRGIGNRRPTLAPPIGVHADRSLVGDHQRPALERGSRGVEVLRGRGKGPECLKRIEIRKGGRGVGRLAGKRVQVKKGNVGMASQRAYALQDYMQALSARLRRVRVCCGEWHRILGPSPTVHIGVTAVFLDPPYGSAGRDKVYNHDSLELAGAVREWCLEHGAERRLRIALCGYEGEHNALELAGWDKLAWKAAGGYGARNPANANGARERIWVSPGCLRPEAGQGHLFGD